MVVGMTASMAVNMGAYMCRIYISTPGPLTSAIKVTFESSQFIRVELIYQVN